MHVYEIQVSSTSQLYRYFDILMLGFLMKIGLMNWNFWIIFVFLRKKMHMHISCVYYARSQYGSHRSSADISFKIGSRFILYHGYTNPGAYDNPKGGFIIWTIEAYFSVTLDRQCISTSDIQIEIDHNRWTWAAGTKLVYKNRTRIGPVPFKRFRAFCLFG